MSLPPFNDGFPTDPQQAINYSYFLTQEESTDWRNWLTSANEVERDELVNILHQMWLQSKAQSAPTNPIQQQTITQQPQQFQPTQQPAMNNPFAQPAVSVQDFNIPVGQPVNVSMSQPATSVEVGSFGVQSVVTESKPIVQTTQINSEPVSPVIIEPKIDKASFSKEVPYTPSPAIADKETIVETTLEAEPKVELKIEPKFESPIVPMVVEPEFSFESEGEVKLYNPTQLKSKKPLIENQIDSIKKDNDENFDDNLDDNFEPNPIKAIRKTSGIDFTEIRENSNKIVLNQLKTDYVQAKQIQQDVYLDFVDKTTEILCNFEDINDYIEAMTDKVLNINDEVIKQSRDIQSLQNSTQTRGPSLQDQTEEIRYDIEKLAKELRNARIEMKRSNDEIRQRLSILEADSFRQANDGIEARLALIKSDMSKMQDLINTLSVAQGNQSPSNFSLPNQNPRISRLDAVTFRK